MLKNPTKPNNMLMPRLRNGYAAAALLYPRAAGAFLSGGIPIPQHFRCRNAGALYGCFMMRSVCESPRKDT